MKQRDSRQAFVISYDARDYAVQPYRDEQLDWPAWKISKVGERDAIAGFLDARYTTQDARVLALRMLAEAIKGAELQAMRASRQLIDDAKALAEAERAAGKTKSR